MKKNVNLAYYRRKDWARLLKIIDDRNSMHDTWEEWYEGFNKIKRDLTATGLTVTEYVVDLDELVRFCQREGIRNDGAARSKFVAKGK